MPETSLACTALEKIGKSPYAADVYTDDAAVADKPAFQSGMIAMARFVPVRRRPLRPIIPRAEIDHTL